MDSTVKRASTSPNHALDTEALKLDVLVENAINGSFEAFDKIMVHYRERMYGVIYNMTLNHSDAADLTQETFVKAFRSISKFKRKSSFFTWLYRIGVNLTLTFLKRKRNRKFFSFEQFFGDSLNEGQKGELASNEINSAKSTMLNELHEKLNEALSRLSDKHRTIVILYEIDGLSHKEISQIMKCTEGTVRSRLHYAKIQLQSMLSEYVC
jgi:RNA polymerase sigma-70 factor (ECF subfamily)